MVSKRITRRDFLKFSCATILNSLLAGVFGYGYSHLIEPGWLDVEQVKLSLPRLSSVFSGLKIVQISDIHMGDWMTRERLSEVVQSVITLVPDIVVMTGDFVIGHDWYGNGVDALPDLEKELSVLTSQYLTLAVLGNHDHWLNAAAVSEMLAASGVREISNDVYTLERDGEQLHIAGVDDIYVGRNRLDLVLENLPEDGASILLTHEPDFADKSAKTNRFDLQLSGHSHGGQVVIPFLGPPALPKYGKKYSAGLYRIGNMWQYTNRGVGMSRPNIRFNCRPEITIFTLESVQAL